MDIERPKNLIGSEATADGGCQGGKEFCILALASDGIS
jgi:hypothetical protein